MINGPQQESRVGVIGLGVMGRNLALNMADNGWVLTVFDSDALKIAELVSQDDFERGESAQRIFAAASLEAMLQQLTSPRIIVLSVPAGPVVDVICEDLIKAGICANDIVVDTGNSLWTDNRDREKRYEGRLTFFATAVSGGEVGARFGPSLMASGSAEAWQRVKALWLSIAARVDDAGVPIERTEPGQRVKIGEPCAAYIGPAGSGNYVKMVHNGIEYADMQLICETYNQLRTRLGMTPGAIAAIFRQWNQGPLDSYLIEISAEVLEQVDPHTQMPLVDVILDKAGQKGTGLWTAVSSLQMGCPTPTIATAVYERAMSTLKEERVLASQILSGPDHLPAANDSETEIAALHDALYCAKICAYAQGFDLMKVAAVENGWELDFVSIARIWRAGCIIRAKFLQSIADAYEKNARISNLLINDFFQEQIKSRQQNWRNVVAVAALSGVPAAAISSALSYYDAYRSRVLPANLLQGQRDYFGAHSFERTDESGSKYHMNWSSEPRVLEKL